VHSIRHLRAILYKRNILSWYNCEYGYVMTCFIQIFILFECCNCVSQLMILGASMQINFRAQQEEEKEEIQ